MHPLAYGVKAGPHWQTPAGAQTAPWTHGAGAAT